MLPIGYKDMTFEEKRAIPAHKVRPIHIEGFGDALMIGNEDVLQESCVAVVSSAVRTQMISVRCAFRLGSLIADMGAHVVVADTKGSAVSAAEACLLSGGSCVVVSYACEGQSLSPLAERVVACGGSVVLVGGNETQAKMSAQVAAAYIAQATVILDRSTLAFPEPEELCLLRFHNMGTHMKEGLAYTNAAQFSADKNAFLTGEADAEVATVLQLCLSGDVPDELLEVEGEAPASDENAGELIGFSSGVIGAEQEVASGGVTDDSEEYLIG